VLLITHRLESVLTADHVVCLHKGHVVAEGTPEVLMNAESSILRQWMDADLQSNEDGDVQRGVNAAE
jgi:ABC-type multidrug transport system fused ATPase/permease subunit